MGGPRELVVRFLKIFRYRTPIDFETGYTCGNLAIAFAVLSFFAQGSAKNDRCAIIKNIYGKRNPHISTFLYLPSTQEVQVSCTSVETGAFLSLRETSHFSPSSTPLFEVPGLNLTTRLWSFEHFSTGLEDHSAADFSTSSFLLSSLPVFEGIMNKKHSQPNAGLGRQLRGARTVCMAAGGHAAPQNFIFEGIIPNAMIFRTQLAAP